MRILITLACGLTLLAQQTQSDKRETPITVPGGFLTGNDYLAMSDAERVVYTEGFFNGMTVALLVADSRSFPNSRWIDDCSRGMRDRQIAEIIRKDIQDKPAEWHHALNVLGLNAMIGACRAYLK